jgi:hypothetical protein
VGSNPTPPAPSICGCTISAELRDAKETIEFKGWAGQPWQLASFASPNPVTRCHAEPDPLFHSSVYADGEGVVPRVRQVQVVEGVGPNHSQVTSVGQAWGAAELERIADPAITENTGTVLVLEIDLEDERIVRFRPGNPDPHGDRERMDRDGKSMRPQSVPSAAQDVDPVARHLHGVSEKGEVDRWSFAGCTIHDG